MQYFYHLVFSAILLFGISMCVENGSFLKILSLHYTNLRGYTRFSIVVLRVMLSEITILRGGKIVKYYAVKLLALFICMT